MNTNPIEKSPSRILQIAPTDLSSNGVASYSAYIKNLMPQIDAFALKSKGLLGYWALRRYDLSGYLTMHSELGYGGAEELWATYWLIRFRPDIKLVLTIHDPPVVTGKPFSIIFPGKSIPVKVLRKIADKTLGALMIKRVVRSAKCIIVLNRLAIAPLTSRFGISADKVVVLPHPAILANPASITTSNQNPRILFFGNISPRKGVELLIRVSEKLIKTGSNFQLTLAGKADRESYQFELENLVNSLDLTKQVHFTGWVDDNALARTLANADIVVLPYLSCDIIHASGPLISAMDFGKPVVASNIPIFAGLIEDGKTGLLFDAGSETDLTNKLSSLLTQKELRGEIGFNAKACIIKEHGDKTIKRKLTAMYARL